MNRDGSEQRAAPRTIRPNRRRSASMIGAAAASALVVALAAIRSPSIGAAASPASLRADSGGGVDDTGRRRMLDDGVHPTTIDDVCVGASLHPGHSLARGEFLCHGALRFGIDAAHGRLILGFVDTVDDEYNNNNYNYNTNNNSNGNNQTSVGANNTDTVAPLSYVAWTAVPNLIFVEKTRPFRNLTLTHDGNLLGFDGNGDEIYDSNYDCDARLGSKADDSVLSISPDCSDRADVAAATAAEGGRTCVRLTGPRMPDAPHGEVTWGVTVHVAAEAAATGAPFLWMTPGPSMRPVPTPAPYVQYYGLQSVTTHPRPTPRPRRTRRPSFSSPASESPTTSPSSSDDDNLFDQGEADLPVHEIEGTKETGLSFEPTGIVWGKAWVDADRNGRVDPFEKNIKNLEVRLFDCTYADIQFVESQRTDNQGMYFFTVRAGANHRVHFDTGSSGIDASEFGFSSGQDGDDADADAQGWTPCETTGSDVPIQWNAGLYDVTAGDVERPERLDYGADAIGGLELVTGTPTKAPVVLSPAESVPVAPVTVASSIGGFIYLDVDESGAMENNERTAAVGGYTVNDAVVFVSLMDCRSETVLETIDVEFPGTYGFYNLTEGYYKLGYEMVALARVERAVPSYSFVDEGDDTSTTHETECGKVGEGELRNDGNVGLRMAPLDILTKGQAEGSLGPDEANLGEMEMVMSPADLGGKTRTAAEETDADSGENDDKSSFVPVLVGVIVALSVITVGSLYFVKRRGGESGAVKTQVLEDAQSISMSVEGDVHSPSADRTAIGSLVVETGKSVATMTATGGESGGESSDESSGTDDEESYTGMEFALAGAAGDFVPPATSPAVPSNEEEIREEGSEGYEVYDDQGDEEHGDYGPVISGMIAEHSRKTRGSDESPTKERNDPRAQGGSIMVNHHQGAHGKDQSRNYSQDQDPHYRASPAFDQDPGHSQESNNQDYHESQNYSQQQHHQQEGNPEYYRYLQHQPHQDTTAIVASGSGAQQQPYYQQYDSGYHQGYYSNASPYDNAPTEPQYQYQYEEQQQQQQQRPQQQYDDQTAVSVSSRSSDPPAASYRDIQRPPSKAMVGWGAAGVPQQRPMADSDSYRQYMASDGNDHDQYAAEHQYAGNDAAAYMASDEDAGVPQQQPTVDAESYRQYMVNDGHDHDQYEAEHQYAANNAAVYPVDDYNSNDQYTAAGDQHVVNEDGTYAGVDYDPNPPQNYDARPQIDSDSSDDDSESGSSLSLLSEEDVDASGWSKSSSTADSSAVSGGSSSQWKNSHAARARRAQSNPRDDRQGWSHRQAVIPENSTTHNAYADPSDGEGGRGRGGDGFSSPNPTVGDERSVRSSGSDQSGDPPGASYKNLHRVFPPPPPRRKMSPGPKSNAAQRARSVPPPGRTRVFPPPR